MRKLATLLGFALTLTTIAPCRASPGDDAIRKEVIARSIASYPGRCPCPYNVDRAGRACGGRSAHSRAGGYAPLCYPADVTDKMIEEFKRKR